jgi:hypothetical protein
MTESDKSVINRAMHCTRCATILLASEEVIVRHYQSNHRLIIDGPSVALLMRLAVPAVDLRLNKTTTQKSKASQNKKTLSSPQKKNSKDQPVPKKGRKECDFHQSTDIMDRGRRQSGSYESGQRK